MIIARPQRCKANRSSSVLSKLLILLLFISMTNADSTEEPDPLNQTSETNQSIVNEPTKDPIAINLGADQKNESSESNYTELTNNESATIATPSSSSENGASFDPPTTVNSTSNVGDVTPTTTITPDISTTIEPKQDDHDPMKCIDENYCLNGGTCVLENGKMVCICPEGFYGARCQTRDICKTVVVDSLTGDQICGKIDRECFRNDKFFRCSCRDDEYFHFKMNRSQLDADGQQSTVGQNVSPMSTEPAETSNKLNSKTQGLELDSRQDNPSYLAECRKIDKCLGVRCRRMSEVCQDGKCICNRNMGYILDPSDKICKLLNPCKLPTSDGQPICGQANCVATYDRDLYRCVCPIGTKPLKVGPHRSSTRCAPFSYFTICDVPLLNKCQHICQMDRMRNHYTCSCHPGYKPGTRVGIDDHMCFFDEHIGQHNYSEPFDSREPHRSGKERGKGKTYDYKFIVKNDLGKQETTEKSTVARDVETPHDGDNGHGKIDRSRSELRTTRNENIVIKRIPIDSLESTQDSRQTQFDNQDDDAVASGMSINKLSPQERCNMYCEENKICVLESGSTDSYRCLCDRQGYVSVGDKCLNWCAAAEFSYKVRGLLDSVCLSGLCEQVNQRPRQTIMPMTEDEMTRLERESSWRPSFECDCSTSPSIEKDETTKLCKLNFDEVLKICLPGNVGYEDCVENKNAYCAVLYKPFWNFLRDIHSDRLSLESNNKQSDDQIGSGTNKSKFKVKDKLYTCVCSPEKKFLVDKPRNKERCVDECELLNVECGRFNRMCRPATIAPEDFGDRNLVRIDQTGVRMNFKRTGCECLPGFNVGPSELLDFTLDDDPAFTPPNEKSSSDIYTPMSNVPSVDSQEESDHFRAKYMNINSRCLLDYDVVEFHASFKAPADFDPTWLPLSTYSPESHQKQLRSMNQRQLKLLNMNAKPLRPSNESIPEASHSPIPGAPQNMTFDAPCEGDNCILKIPDFVKLDISDLHKKVVMVAECDGMMATLSIDAYERCIKYRYWIVQKLRTHFIDWRRVINRHLSETFEYMDGNIRLHVNKCESKIRDVRVALPQPNADENSPPTSLKYAKQIVSKISGAVASNKVVEHIGSNDILDGIYDEQAIIDADIQCELTLHSASDESSPRYSRKVLLEKQLQKFIYAKPNLMDENYYFMAPKMLIKRESFDQLAEHRQLFNPCKSDYEYCDKQTKCEMVDTVNFTCTCDYGYTPIGSRDIYLADSRKEVCEDINECLFDVCKELANVSTCINEIGDYRCQCNRHYTGDNKRYCTHVCNTIPCKHGRCRLVDDHHAFCECDDGYKDTDCSVQDPNVALRRANMIICGSISFSILLLAITTAISINSQLRKAKKKLKRLEALNDVAQMAEFSQQPYRGRISSKVSN